MLTYEQLRATLEYSVVTGYFYRRASGKRVGTHDRSTGAVKISQGGKTYYAHRLAMLYVEGTWPCREVDHINGSRLCNSWHNIRHADRQFNQENIRQAHRNNQAGLLGVSPARAGRYRATIVTNNKQEYLGDYDTAEAAHEAYLLRKREIHKGSTL